DGRVAVEGPEVLLRAKAVVSLGMALHELASNAASHGALSVPEGRVRLVWRIENPGSAEARLEIRWRESGGPQVARPQQNGYGAELIENGLQQQIGASASISFAARGLSAVLTLPVSSGLVVEPEQPQIGTRSAANN